MTQARSAFLALASLATACAPPASDTSQSDGGAASVPEEIASVALAAMPDVTITGGELNPGNGEFEIVGTLPNGGEVEFDMVQENGNWAVLEIQRDIAWSTVPEPVRAVAAAQPDPFEPARVIESTQGADGSIVYELFRATADGSPAPLLALEVRWHEGNAEALP